MVTLGNRGKFELQTDMIKADPEYIAEMFSQLRIVPFRCETDFLRNTICYEAISENFEEVPETQSIPEYIIIVTREESGKLHFGVEKHDFFNSCLGVPFSPQRGDDCITSIPVGSVKIADETDKFLDEIDKEQKEQSEVKL